VSGPAERKTTNRVVLANYLRSYARSGRPIPREDLEYIADFLENKIKRPVGRPKINSATKINVTRLSLATSYAQWLLERLRRKYGRKHNVTLRNGKTCNIREEAIEHAVRWYNRRASKDKRSGIWRTVTVKEVRDRMERPKNRRH
jgi:hypothetical protein